MTTTMWFSFFTNVRVVQFLVLRSKEVGYLIIWSPPSEGSMKFKAEGAIRQKTGLTGIGGILFIFLAKINVK